MNVCVFSSRIVNGAATVSLNTPSNTTYHERQQRTPKANNKNAPVNRDSAMHAGQQTKWRNGMVRKKQKKKKVRPEHCTIRAESLHKSHNRHVAPV